MNIKEEKIILLSAISTLQKEMLNSIVSIDAIQRYHNLINCLIVLNWKEIERRNK